MEPRRPRDDVDHGSNHDGRRIQPTPGGLGSMTHLQKAALAVGAVFILIGLLGFMPGVTTRYDLLRWFGPQSEALLLGIFQVSILHNLVHLGFGIVGVFAARMIGSSRVYLLGGGALYGVLWLYGLLVDKDSDANFVPLNTADDWLHLFLAVVMIGLGLALTNRPSPGRP
jgi:arginine exporter protein ArgO